MIRSRIYFIQVAVIPEIYHCYVSKSTAMSTVNNCLIDKVGVLQHADMAVSLGEQSENERA